MDIKKRGIVLLSVPRTEALASPNSIEQTTTEPTPIWTIHYSFRDLYKQWYYAHIRAQHMLTRSHGRVIKITPGASTVATFEIEFEICEISGTSQTQRRVNALYVLEITSHPEPPCCFFGIGMPKVQLGSAWAAILNGSEIRCKDRHYILINLIYISKKFRKLLKLDIFNKKDWLMQGKYAETRRINSLS